MLIRSQQTASLFLTLSLLLAGSCSHKVKIIAPAASEVREHHESEAKNVMITTQGSASTEAGLEIFDKGGNIIDAFVATSFAISVERPQSTGIGGGGFLLYFSRSEDKVYAFDFRETGPEYSNPKMFLSRHNRTQPLLSQVGGLAVATPGLVAGLYDLHSRFGKLAWKDVMAPAIRIAASGVPVSVSLHEAIRDRKNILKLDSDASKIFFTANGEPMPVGSTLIQSDLAKTLEIIAAEGRKGFYQGKVAKSIVKTVRKNKGILSLRDLKKYAMKEREPVTAMYNGLKVYSMPPPSSGGIHVIQILKMLEPHNLKGLGPQTAASTHLTAMSMQRAFQDRALYLGDPDFQSVPTRSLLNEKYLQQMALEINKDKAIPAKDLKPIQLPYESSETTHFTIADKEGNLVSSTQTINGWFGSGVVAQGTGIVLNNEMDDFAQKVGAQNLFGAVGGKNNLPEPRKRPLSSMSPTIITKEGKPYIALGSPSGTRIINCVAQTILNVVEYEMPLYQAVAATRIHQQWQPDELKIEEPFLSPKVEEQLRQKGHNVVHGRLGCSIQAIKREEDSWVGVSDPRGEGLALGR